MSLMLSNHYYHDLLRKYVIAFGQMFTHTQVIRFGSDGFEVERQVVPISYGPREKWVVRNEQDENLVRKGSIVLPRMSFEMTGLNYAPQRKQPTMTLTRYTEHREDATEYEQFNKMFAPVPYDIYFRLNIITKSIDDASQIVEQIVPFYTPEFTLRLNLVPNMDIKTNIPIVLENLNMNDSYYGSFEERRTIVWTIDFRLGAFLYGPTRQSAFIAETNVNTRLNDEVASTETNSIQADSPQTPNNTVFPNPYYRAVIDDFGFSLEE